MNKTQKVAPPVVARKIFYTEKSEVIHVIDPTSVTYTEGLLARAQFSFQILPEFSKHAQDPEIESLADPVSVTSEPILPPRQCFTAKYVRNFIARYFGDQNTCF